MNKRTSSVLKFFLAAVCLACLFGITVLLVVYQNPSAKTIIIELAPTDEISAWMRMTEQESEENIFDRQQVMDEISEEQPVQPLEADESGDAVQISLQEQEEEILVEGENLSLEENLVLDETQEESLPESDGPSLPVLTDEYLTPEPVFPFLLSPVKNEALTPRLVQQNMRPIDYKRPAELVPDKPNIAVIIPNLGLQETLTQQIINSSMPEVTLAFNPQTLLFEPFLRQAREQGHETLVDLSFVRQFPADALKEMLDTHTAAGLFVLNNRYLSHLVREDSYLLIDKADDILREPFTKEAVHQAFQDLLQSLNPGERVVLVVPAIPLVINELISFMRENSSLVNFIPASTGAF